MGGAETSLLVAARSLQSRFELAVACPVPSPLAEALGRKTIEFHGLPAPPCQPYTSPRSCGYWVKAVHRLTAIARLVRPDVIHANNLCAGMAALPAAIVMGTRLVMHARDFPRHRWAMRLCGKYCDRVIAVSSSVRDNLVRGGIDPSKIRVIHNAVDTALGRECEGRRDTTGSGGQSSCVFANVGQLVPWKNQSLFLDAAARVAERSPQSEFLLVGDDIFGRNRDYRRRILDRARSSPVADRITSVGWQDDMNGVWPAIDCLVHTADREPFGRVVIEAMLHRIPVIAVDACGPSEIIENDRVGILVAPNDVEALASAMLQIAQAPQAAKQIGAAGCNHVLSKFTVAQMTRGLLDVYAEVLA